MIRHVLSQNFTFAAKQPVLTERGYFGTSLRHVRIHITFLYPVSAELARDGDMRASLLVFSANVNVRVHIVAIRAFRLSLGTNRLFVLVEDRACHFFLTKATLYGDKGTPSHSIGVNRLGIQVLINSPQLAYPLASTATLPPITTIHSETFHDPFVIYIGKPYRKRIPTHWALFRGSRDVFEAGGAHEVPAAGDLGRIAEEGFADGTVRLNVARRLLHERAILVSEIFPVSSITVSHSLTQRCHVGCLPDLRPN